MAKKKTTKAFIREARAVHGDKYDYSRVEYVNSRTKVCIICPIHGTFHQSPEAHIRLKQGCPKCGNQKKKKPIERVGIYDKDNKSTSYIYKLWREMIRRCYNPKCLERRPTYQGCSVCEEWKYFSNFEKWVLSQEYYTEGYQLDKDVLVKGNKMYSPDTCCLIPREINIQLSGHYKKTSQPKGVFLQKNGTYSVHCASPRYKSGFVGTFNSEIEAFNAYKKAKEQRLKELAEEYKNVISKKVYEALYNYQVEITD